MDDKIAQRKLLTLAVIAFDLIIKDCLAHENQGDDFHPVATEVLKELTDMLSHRPNLNVESQQYLLNVAEIAADIKHLFLRNPISDDSLQDMLALQANRLELLKDLINDQRNTLH